MNLLGDNKWLVFVLPGFIALFVASFISDFPQIRDSQLPIVYIALTALSVVVPFAVVHLFGRAKGIGYQPNALLISPAFIASVLACSIVLGFLFGVAHTTDYVSRGLRSIFGQDIVIKASYSDSLHLLLKTSYKERLIDGHPFIKSTSNRYVRIYSGEDRNVYEGVVTTYFEATESPQLYLSPACVVKDGKATPILGPGAWVGLDKVSDIQFIEATCSPCAKATRLVSGQPYGPACLFPGAPNPVAP